MTAMQLSDQQRIGARYELRRCIGVGGMARVYLAHDETLNRDVAVKILNPALASDPLFVERFRREAQAAAMLNHPNIVTIYDTGTTDDTYYIVMEYVPGPNLKEALRERGPMPQDQVLTIGAQVAAALEAAHGRGLIHRDIKPHNILLQSAGTAKVTDFGIARAAGASQLTATQTVMGSAHYLSPEQALHQPVDGRSDLYSLGIVLYEALTGRLPFDGDSLVAVAMKHVHEEPAPPRTLRPAITPEAETVVMKALAKNPAERFQSAGEMRNALLSARDWVRQSVMDAARPLPEERPEAVAEHTTFRSMPPGVPPPPESPPPEHYPIGPHEAPERRNRGFIVPLLIAAICAIALGGALFATRLANRSGSANVAPTSAPRPTVNAQATTVTLATPSPGPTQPPPAPTAQPTAVAIIPPAAPPAPAPTATAVPPTAAPAPLPPTVRPTVATGASTPDGAVQEFYRLVAQHQFDAAAQLWTDRMKQQYPVDENLVGHFNPATRVDVQIGKVAVDDRTGRATVAVDVTEFRTIEPTTRRYVGSWNLVRGPSGWLLDQPNLNPA
jgi:serine/threonine protein kinase